MRKVLTIIGFLIGGYIGFLNRPAVPLVGQLPFEKVIFAGTNLKGIDQIFITTARASFNSILLGAGIGILAAIILSSILVRVEK